MKLLVCTQIMDKEDSTLGFFQKWASLLGGQFDVVNVVCLKEGKHTLPDNVQVHSLGKESARGGGLIQRLRYAFRFYSLVWKLRHEYDAVFVHMNQEYVLLGGILWKVLGKKIFMWRNHYDGSILTDIAALFCTKVFCTSKFSYTAKYKKTVLMPVGVDQESAHIDEVIERKPNSILFLGRLDISKKPHILIDALGILSRKGIQFTATFVGGPSKDDAQYPEGLRAQVERLGLGGCTLFTGAVPNTETYRYYRSHEIFVNCSRSGMLDKTMFKAVACGCLVLVTSKDFADMAGQEFSFADDDREGLAQKIEEFLALNTSSRTHMTEKLNAAIKQHALPVLVERLKKEIC